MLLALPSLFADLPQPVLGAVVISAALSLADIPATRRLYRQRRSDFALSMVAFFGVVLLGVLPGIVVAISLSVANVFRRVWRPHQALLGRVRDLPGYHDTGMYPQAELLSRAVIYRFDAPLIFANANTFRDEVRRLAKGAEEPFWIIVAAEPMTDVDTTGCDMLDDLALDLQADGCQLVFAELKDPVGGCHSSAWSTRFPTTGSIPRSSLPLPVAAARPAAIGNQWPHDRSNQIQQQRVKGTP